MDEHQSNGQKIIVQPAENIVEIDGGNMFTTSLIVAQAFEKEHKDVLRAISNLECSEEFNERNFAPIEYKDAKGEMRPAYRMSRDGFSFLTMGFTGKKAAAWKEKFLEAFNTMEKALHSPILPIPDVPRGGRRDAAQACGQTAARIYFLLGFCGKDPFVHRRIHHSRPVPGEPSGGDPFFRTAKRGVALRLLPDEPSRI